MRPPNVLPEAAVARFREEVAALTGGGDAALGLAVSGGPDSLGLLLLALAGLGRQGFRVFTVDHGLRAEAAAEAAFVARLCAERGIAHEILTVDWPERPRANIQARARAARYALLAERCRVQGLAWLATAHHLDDQAETLLMRLARGSGGTGLAGMPAARPLGAGVTLIRPLLGWTRADLAMLVGMAGLDAVDDPANHDPRHDRTQVRRLLADTPWLSSRRLAAAAAHLASEQEALDWCARDLAQRRILWEGEALLVDPRDLPIEMQRRLLMLALAHFQGPEPRGSAVSALLRRLREGGAGTLGPVLAAGGARWRLRRAPPRRAGSLPRTVSHCS